MQNYEAFEPYRVLGSNMQNIVEAFGSFSLVASMILGEEGLGTTGSDGIAKFEPNQWYPLKSNLKALSRISSEYGEFIIRQTAAAVLKNATFPPTVTDILSGLKSLDVAYHMNHAFNGQPMFSLETGKMQDGIGNYLCKPMEGKKEIHMVCTTPYLCSFDQSLVQSMARRFEPTANVVHLDPATCRAKGGKSCTYSVTWR